MSSLEWLLIYVALGLSTVVNIIVPISGSAVVTPLLALLTDPYHAIGIASFFFFLSAIVRAYMFRNDIQWNEIRILLFPSVVAALFGALVVIAIPQQILLLIILLFSIYFLLKKLNIIPKQEKPSRILNHFVGLLSGFLQGTGLAGSDLRNQYLYAQNLNIPKVHGTTAFIGAANFFVATSARLLTQQLTLPDITQLLYLFPIIIIATWAGRHLLYKLPPKISNYIVVFVMSAVVILLGYKIFIG